MPSSSRVLVPSPAAMVKVLFVVLLMLYPPSCYVSSFLIGKRGEKTLAATATPPPPSSPSNSKSSSWLWGGSANGNNGNPADRARKGLGKMFAEALGADGGGGGSEDCHAPDELMRKRGAENYKKAVAEYKKLLAAEPENASLKLKLADASVCLMRTLTNANAVLIDGISDSDENRKIWREYAFDAYDLLKDLHKAQPEDARIHTLMAEAFTYRTSSKGILKAAVTGDGITFIKIVEQIVTKHPSFDAGVPFIFRGAFLLAAPWPLKNIDKAVVAFESACKVAPNSLRNNYFLGVGMYHKGAYEKALVAFERAVGGAESIAGTEWDVADFFRRESKRSLEVTKQKLAEVKK